MAAIALPAFANWLPPISQDHAVAEDRTAPEVGGWEEEPDWPASPYPHEGWREGWHDGLRDDPNDGLNDSLNHAPNGSLAEGDIDPVALPLYPQPASLAGVAMPPDQEVGGWIRETEQRAAHSAAQLRGSGAGGGMPAPIARRSLDPDRPVGYGLWQGGSFPVENFQTYTSAFGYRRSATGGRGSEFHRGLDIAAPRGSYIRNWWAGQVVRVSSGDSCGTAITVQSGQWQHIYCHMSGRVETRNGQRYLVDRDGGIEIPQGQVIPAGTRIGRVGMTGRTTGPHLHWGIRYAGNLVDPALVLRAMYAEQRRSPV